jgi:hypothetical protein
MFQWIIDRVFQLKKNFLADVLSQLDGSQVARVFLGFSERERVYHTLPLFRTFLAQVVGGDSCRKAIERGIDQGWLPRSASPKTAAYCNARTRLPEIPLQELAFRAGARLAAAVPARKRFMGRPVKVVDGTSAKLPDTPANQSEYPQPGSQARGCGDPLMHFAALMDLDTGGILDVETWPEGDSERSGFRTLWRSLKKGDIALGDGGLGSYADMAWLLGRGVDSVFDAGQRKFDLPLGDHRVTLRRPAALGYWVKARQLPETLDVRVIRFQRKLPGGRRETITLMTTLLDAQRYSARKIMRLYRRRWEMELRLRDIKTTMGLERMHLHTPESCRKELWMGVLGYNLIRTVMCAAARRVDKPVARISFAGTLHRLDTFGMGRLRHTDPATAWRLLLEHVAEDLLPVRPNRLEPRKVKGRPKPYPLLMQPRHLERQQLLTG